MRKVALFARDSAEPIERRAQLSPITLTAVVDEGGLVCAIAQSQNRPD